MKSISTVASKIRYYDGLKESRNQAKVSSCIHYDCCVHKFIEAECDIYANCEYSINSKLLLLKFIFFPVKHPTMMNEPRFKAKGSVTKISK